ncbi:P-loop containing nucleoside triphosphate hydrolase protein [Panaeolus papilionaceus]|nr:P-loop containing nucleoside triphosphate hydrolase protein [Panaeolus papilionaceus]
MDMYGDVIDVTGPVSIQLAHDELRHRNRHNIHLILLLGATGSGKSTFIECIGNDKSIQISGNKLDGVTQDLSIYRLNNVYRLGGLPIYLMDTPGFADDKLPETRILRMIQSFMEDYNLGFIKRILYFSPITDTRVTSSKSKILNILKAITGLSTENNITIVTTLWDQLWREDQTVRANEKFEELQRVYWRVRDSETCVCSY